MVVCHRYFDGPDTSSHQIISHMGDLARLPSGYMTFPITCSEPSLVSWLGSPYTMFDVAKVSDGASTSEAYLIRDSLMEGCAGNWEKSCGKTREYRFD